jgi:hypothetical protein
MKSLFLIVFIFVLSIPIYGQGSFLDKGQNGFGFSAGFVTNKDVSGFGGSLGYSVSGIFDLGISLTRFGFVQQLLGSDISAIVISPDITFYILKQDDDMPISFSIGADYEWQDYSNDVLKENNITQTGGYFSIGGSFMSIVRT